MTGAAVLGGDGLASLGDGRCDLELARDHGNTSILSLARVINSDAKRSSCCAPATKVPPASAMEARDGFFLHAWDASALWESHEMSGSGGAVRSRRRREWAVSVEDPLALVPAVRRVLQSYWATPAASHRLDCAAEAVAEYVRKRVGADTRPGIVVSIATSGDLVQWHPHGHLILTDGGFSDDGAFHPLPAWDGEAVMKLFRERLLARLIERHAISEDLARKLLAWKHPGFSAHIGDTIPFEDKKAIEDVACYLVRAPMSLKKLVYLDGQKAVLYRSRMNPSSAVTSRQWTLWSGWRA